MEGTDTVEDKARLRVKLGAAEIEYEGGAASLEKLVMPTVAKMIEMVESHVDLQRPTVPLQIEGKALAPDAQYEQATQSAQRFGHSTNTIAVALKAGTGPDLALAASAHLGLVKGKETFSRKEILDEMKSATGFFSANTTGNLTKILAKLTRANRLHLVGAEAYALANDEKTRLERLLAEIK